MMTLVRGRGGVAALVAVILGLYLCNFAAVELSFMDESRSGVIVRDIRERRHLLQARTPDGELCEKPPAYYLLCAALSAPMGLNEWSLRGVSVVMAAGTLFVVAALAGLFGSRRAAAIAVVALASNPIFISMARQALVDMTLTFFITAGLAAYFGARVERIRAGVAAPLCGACLGLATLTKGPIGLAFPMWVMAADLLLETRGRFWRARIPWGPCVTALALAAGLPLLWYVPGLLSGGREFLNTAILSENLYMPLGEARGIGVSHHKPPYWYFICQAGALLPMLPLLPLTVRWASRRTSDPARVRLVSWGVGGFIFFLVASTKRVHYLLPLQPAFAVMVGLAASACAEDEKTPLVSRGAALAGALLLIGSAGGLFILLRPSTLSSDTRDLVRHHWVEIGLFVLGAACLARSLIVASRRFPRDAIGVTLALGLFVIACATLLRDGIQPDLNNTKPFVQAMLRRVSHQASPVVLPRIHGYGLDFYWPEPLIHDEIEAARAPYVFVRRSRLEALGGDIEICGTLSVGHSERDVLLVRRNRACPGRRS